MGFYDDMAAMAVEVLAPDSAGGLGQGMVTLTRTTEAATDPDTPWAGGEPTDAVYTLSAAVRGVSQKYVDGTQVLASDLQITCGVTATNASGATVPLTPVMTDRISIDGAAKAPKRILPIPAAGIAAAFIIIVAG